MIPFPQELCFPWRPSPRTHPGSTGRVRVHVCTYIGGAHHPLQAELCSGGWRHCLPVPTNNASLAVVLFCFCHIRDGFPTLLPLLVLETHCMSFVYFVLREPDGQSWGGQSVPPPGPGCDSPLNRQLTHRP